MKNFKKYGAAIMLLPAIYLVSCGSGNNERDRQDTLSTQSPPPTQMNPSASEMDTTDNPGSALQNGETETTNSAVTGSTSGTGNTGTNAGNTGMSGSDRTVVPSAGVSKKRSSKTSRTATYHHNTGTTYKTSLSKEKSSKSDDQLTTEGTKTTTSRTSDMERMKDTAAGKLRTMGDTTAKRILQAVDTVAMRMDRMADTTAQTLGRLGDSSTMAMNRMMTKDSSTERYMDTLSTMGYHQSDSSRSKSTTDTGTNFTSSVFIPEQIRSNYADIKMARMAIEKSQNEAVKQVARTLENDHNSLLRELQVMNRNSASGIDSLSMPQNDMAMHHMDMMKNSSGEEFDRQWLQHMHMMHDQEIKKFEQAESSSSLQDAELRIWIEKTLPTLRKHRDMLAQTLNTINK